MARNGAPRVQVTQWDRDPELAEFVRGRLGKVPQTVILAEAVERFGEARAPKRSALNRFAVKWSLARAKGAKFRGQRLGK